MNVRELIALLQREDPEAEVRREQDSHDFWRTVLLAEVLTVDEAIGRRSDYHRSMMEVDDDEVRDGDVSYIVIR